MSSRVDPATTHRRDRVFWTITIGVSTALAASAFRHVRVLDSDFSITWAAARGWLQGQNPYDVVGPGRAFEWAFPMLYPMPAILVGVPFSVLPQWVADCAFIGLGAAAMAWALTRERITNPQMLVFLSFPFLYAVEASQWSPLLTAAALIPGAGWLLVCKPSTGLALFLAYPSRKAIIGGCAFVLLSLAAMPSWPWHWLDAMSGATWHMSAPVMRPLGWITVAGLLKWRRPEARLLAALACVPQTPSPYEALPLFLVIRTWADAFVITACAAIPFLAVNVFDLGISIASWVVWAIYLPCLALVLRRPNEGASIADMLRGSAHGVQTPREGLVRPPRSPHHYLGHTD
jgi:hypothetical protein